MKPDFWRCGAKTTLLPARRKPESIPVNWAPNRFLKADHSAHVKGGNVHLVLAFSVAMTMSAVEDLDVPSRGESDLLWILLTLLHNVIWGHLWGPYDMCVAPSNA